ncbi:MAG: tetratricopeptide repeat protein [Verrucomicrobia bacterium]|nr:tetratricopeptide repeat protein [Verrucomicrobiota bacterium]
MSRFSNLEFGDSFEELPSRQRAVKDGGYYLEAAHAAFRQGRFEQALRAYSKVLEFDSRNLDAWTLQVRMLIELGEFREANLWADKAMEFFPDEPEALAVKAVSLARLGNIQEALMFSDSSIEARGNTAYVWLARGDVFLARKEGRAEFCFEKALGLFERGGFVYWLISRSCYFYKQFSLAFKYAHQAVSLDASQAILWLQFARCQLALGLSGPASNSFLQARQLDPQCQPDPEEIAELSSAGLWSWIRGRWRRNFGK